MSEFAEPLHILLDASVLIDYSDIHSRLPDNADAAISAVSVAELAAGIHAATDPVRQAQRQLRFQWVVTARRVWSARDSMVGRGSMVST